VVENRQRAWFEENFNYLNYPTIPAPKRTNSLFKFNFYYPTILNYPDTHILVLSSNIVTGQTQQLTELLPAGGRRCIRAFLTQFDDFDSVELVQVRATAMQKWRIVRLGFGTS
jgi:hypothetical protein